MPSCCGRDAEYPSVRKMAENASKTILHAIRHAASSGEIVAHEDVIKHRSSICSTCSKKSGVRCIECGCYLSLKTAVAVSTCPLGRW